MRHGWIAASTTSGRDFSVTLGLAARGSGQPDVRSDPPLVAIFLLVIGASLVAKPLFTRTA